MCDTKDEGDDGGDGNRAGYDGGTGVHEEEPPKHARKRGRFRLRFRLSAYLRLGELLVRLGDVVQLGRVGRLERFVQVALVLLV